MATEVTYNGVTIHGCTTRRLYQESKYDQSGTDLLYYTFHLRVQGYVHGLGSAYDTVYTAPPAGVSGSFSGGAPDAYEKIRYRLSEPRQELNYTIDGVSVLTCSAFQDSADTRIIANKDVNNGPKPQVLDVTHIVGANMFRIEWEVEIAILGCDDGDSGANNGSRILSNRWSMQDDINDQFMRTRTYTGRLRTVSALVNPLSLTPFVLPILQKGFRRERIQYTVSSSGVELDYTITDREVHQAAPEPATGMDIEHTESTGDEILAVGECYVRLTGDRNADHRQLIQLAVQIVDSKLGIVANFDQGKDGGSIVESFSITDVSGTSSHEVRVRARVRHNEAKFLPGNNAVNPGVANPRNLLGKPLSNTDVGVPGYDSLVAKDLSNDVPLPIAAAFSCALQIPCDGKHAFGENAVSVGDEESAQNQEGLVEVEGVQSETELPPDTSNDYRSAAQKANAYTYYQADNRYSGVGGEVQLPIAREAVSPGDNSPTSAFVRLFQEVVRRVLTVKAERVGAWPVLPSPQSYTDENGIEHRVLNYELMPGTRDRTPGGRDFIYRSEAHYVWGLSRGLLEGGASTLLRIGRMPWDAILGDETLTMENFLGDETSSGSGGQ